MFNKLESIFKHFEELTRSISDPKVIANNAQYQKLGKERSDLEPLVITYLRYKEVKKQIQDAKLMVDDKDAELKKMAKEEWAALEPDLTQLEERLKVLLLPKDPLDEKNIMLEIRAGTGGDEAALFAGDLFRMYTKYAEAKRWKFEILESSPTGLGGFKEVIAQIKGQNVYSELKYESGIHRVQRVPTTEQQGRVHTSAVTVAVLPEPEEVEVHIEPQDLRVDTYAAGGPGGQHVNKTESAVRLTHIPSGLVVVCQDERSQHKNKARAMKILQIRLYEKILGEQQKEQSDARKIMVGSGDRSEKIRTYNFPQNRLTDHRIGLTIYQLDKIIDGHLEDVIGPIKTHYQTEALKSEFKEGR